MSSDQHFPEMPKVKSGYIEREIYIPTLQLVSNRTVLNESRLSYSVVLILGRKRVTLLNKLPYHFQCILLEEIVYLLTNYERFQFIKEMYYL